MTKLGRSVGTAFAAILLTGAAVTAAQSAQWRSDEDSAGRTFSFMGLAIGEPIDQAKQRFQFNRCVMNDNRSVEAWGAATSADGALVLYVTDGKVAAMQYFFDWKRAGNVLDDTVETYGKATWREPPLRGGRASAYKWNTPSGVLRYYAYPNRIGSISVNQEHLERVIQPGYWMNCGLDDAVKAFKASSIHPGSSRYNPAVRD